MPDIFTPNKTHDPTPPKIVGESVAAASNRQTILQTIMSKQPLPIHAFTSYCEMPKGITFDTQQPNEIILLFLRSDLITNIPWIAGAILLLFAPFILIYAVQISNSPFQFLPSNFILIIELFYFLTVASYIFVNFITWYFNVSLITDKRVIDVDFEDLIYKNVSGTTIRLVQDVSFTQTGAIRTVFNFGDVLIQTAAAVDNFTLKAVPQPERVVQFVEALLEQEKGEGTP